MSKPSAIETFNPKVRYVFRICDPARTKMSKVVIEAESRDDAQAKAVAAFKADPIISEAFPDGIVEHVNTLYGSS